MLRAIRTRITPATVIATFALIFAMTGGAYAAKRFLITSTKQISPKVLSSLKGAKGTTGAAGAAGPTGPQGPAGAIGKEGPVGKDGAPGKEGTKGETGPEGTPGKNGTFGEGTLPAGVTEKGAWSLTVTDEGVWNTAITFPTPLAAGLEESHVRYVPVPDGPPVTNNPDPIHCSGSAEDPTAAAGYLCVYASVIETSFGETESLKVLGSTPIAPISESTHATDVFGFRLQFVEAKTEEAINARGSWAVNG